MERYVKFYGKEKETKKVVVRTEVDIIKDNFKFIWDDDIEEPIQGESLETWEKRIAKKYYDKLFKEYCLADLSLYKEGKTALRWRSEEEVVNGKGQIICGNIKCDKTKIKAWEINFAYMENSEKKNALVKVSLCKKCTKKLNYKKEKDSDNKVVYILKLRAKKE